jgi:hypothetical protein
MNKNFVLLPALASLLALTLPTASAVPVTFSGGNGSPLSMTLLQPVTYTITSGFAGNIRFVFQNTGNLAGEADGVTSATSSINFTINSGPPSDFVNRIGSLIPTDPVIPSDPTTPNDLFVFDASSLDALLIGDTVVLSAGTLMTANVDGPISIPQAPPVGTDFSTFIVGHLDPVSVRISGPGTVGSVSVPDSLSTLWLGLPIAVMLAFAQLRRLAVRFQPA